MLGVLDVLGPDLEALEELASNLGWVESLALLAEAFNEDLTEGLPSTSPEAMRILSTTRALLTLLDFVLLLALVFPPVPLVSLASLAALAEAIDEDSVEGLPFTASDAMAISLTFLAAPALLGSIFLFLLVILVFLVPLALRGPWVFREPWVSWVSRGPWGPWGSLVFLVSVALLVVVELMVEAKLVESRLVVVDERGVNVDWIPCSVDP